MKRFAYSGFAITLVSASIAHWSVGDDTKYVVNPLVFLGALIASYIYLNKLSVAAAHRVDAIRGEPPARINRS